MKRFLLIIEVIAGLLLIIWKGLLASGMGSRNSLAMVLKVAIGRSGGAGDIGRLDPTEQERHALAVYLLATNP